MSDVGDDRHRRVVEMTRQDPKAAQIAVDLALKHMDPVVHGIYGSNWQRIYDTFEAAMQCKKEHGATAKELLLMQSFLNSIAVLRDASDKIAEEMEKATPEYGEAAAKAVDLVSDLLKRTKTAT